MTPAEVASVGGRTQIVDVREDPEWRAGRIPGAVHIPLSQLERRIGELDPGTPVVTVCRSGNRSAHAAALLTRRGYETANLAGGVKAWVRAGLPFQGHHGQPGTIA